MMPAAVEKEWTRDAGSWRVEVSPSRPAKQDLFLHVLETDSSEIAAPGAVTLSGKPGSISLRIRAQGRSYDLSFSTMAPSAHLSIQDHGHVVVDRELT